MVLGSSGIAWNMILQGYPMQNILDETTPQYDETDGQEGDFMYTVFDSKVMSDYKYGAQDIKINPVWTHVTAVIKDVPFKVVKP